MSTFELRRINEFLLKKHHLTQDSKIDDIIQITDDICGLHSTNLSTSYLSLFARTNMFKKEDLEAELYVNRNLGRIRGMRRTLFIETLKMIPIIHSATFKLMEGSFEKFMEVRGVSLKDYREISPQILHIIKDKELSASEIRKGLNSTLDIPAIIQVMCNYGLLIRGRPIKDWKDRRNKYALFDDYFPTVDLVKFTETQAVQKLVERYIKAYGPVTEDDISWWSGLNKTKIREAIINIDSRLERIKIFELQGEFMLYEDDLETLENLEPSQKTTINFLPELDPYPMGFKERDRFINKKNYNYVFDKSGNIAATILLNGVVIGVWDTENNKEAVVKLYLFELLEKELTSKLHSRAQEVGKFFFDEEVVIKECRSMIPLTVRTAGGFMTPLKDC
ncbi:MAG: winged helix DNA-binding domain-containing protein [Promethearchaeota archaeon]